MKPVLVDKLLLLGELNERKEDDTTFFSSVLGNLDGEGRQIDEGERTYGYQRLPTLLENQLQNL